MVADLADIAVRTGDKRISEIPNALESYGQLIGITSARESMLFLDYDGTLSPIVSDPSAALWFDPAAYTAPQAPYRNGTVGKGSLRGPGVAVLNLSLSKEFTIAEAKTVEFRWENFNALNHVNYNSPNLSFGSPTFGALTSDVGPRAGQISARVTF